MEELKETNTTRRVVKADSSQSIIVNDLRPNNGVGELSRRGVQTDGKFTIEGQEKIYEGAVNQFGEPATTYWGQVQDFTYLIEWRQLNELNIVTRVSVTPDADLEKVECLIASIRGRLSDNTGVALNSFERHFKTLEEVTLYYGAFQSKEGAVAFLVESLKASPHHDGGGAKELRIGARSYALSQYPYNPPRVVGILLKIWGLGILEDAYQQVS